MSSLTIVDLNSTRAFIENVPDLSGSEEPEKLTMRQKRLLKYWHYYRCSLYENRAIDWNGHKELDEEETLSVYKSGFVPSGYEDIGLTLPIKFRRPSTPYFLARAIVAKFTGLLFSSKRHPTVKCDDPETEDWLNAFIEETQLWATAIALRTDGGGRGSCAIGFKFVNGKPILERHNTTWCTPTWEDRAVLELRSLDKRFQYPVDVMVKGRKVKRWFWYRRLIDTLSDTVWDKVPVSDDGSEPDWRQYPSEEVPHGFGFCPVVWIQNEENNEGADGDPDCYGAFELIEELDALLSQASRGTKSNCDPTLGIAADAEFDEIKKGSNNAIQVEKGGTVTYLEMTGSGIDRAQKLADDLEKRILTITRCQLDYQSDNGPARSELEVNHQYSAMTERADGFREQYGERGIKRLLTKVLYAAQRLTSRKTIRGNDGSTSIIVQKIQLPPKKVELEDGNWEYVDRKLGRGRNVTLKWPQYYAPSLAAIQRAVEAVGAAYVTYKIIDQRNAVEFIAPFLDIEDPVATIRLIEEAVEKKRQEGSEDPLDAALRGLVAPE